MKNKSTLILKSWVVDLSSTGLSLKDHMQLIELILSGLDPKLSLLVSQIYHRCIRKVTDSGNFSQSPIFVDFEIAAIKLIHEFRNLTPEQCIEQKCLSDMQKRKERRFLCYLLREYGRWSYPRISSALGISEDGARSNASCARIEISKAKEYDGEGLS